MRVGASSESGSFWPDLQAESEPLGGTRACRPFDLHGSIVTAARPSLWSLRGALSRRQRLRVGPAGLLGAAALALLGGACAFLLVRTQSSSPLVPPELDSAEWNRAWLTVAAAEYYGVCLCLCGFIVCSEPPGQAACWSFGCCLLGAPISCLYAATRILRHGTLGLRRYGDT